MFHDVIPYTPKLSGNLVFEAINKLVAHIDSEGFVPKYVVAADYLTTLYQLLHLRDKYEGP